MSSDKSLYRFPLGTQAIVEEVFNHHGVVFEPSADVLGGDVLSYHVAGSQLKLPRTIGSDFNYLRLPVDTLFPGEMVLSQVRVMKDLKTMNRTVQVQDGVPLTVPTKNFMKTFKKTLTASPNASIGAPYDEKIANISVVDLLPQLIVGAVYLKRQTLIDAVLLTAETAGVAIDYDKASDIAKRSDTIKKFSAWLQTQQAA